MEHNLVWSELAAGLACWIAALALTRAKRFGLSGIDGAVPRLYTAFAAALPLILFAATLPSHGLIFAPGHDLGWGFLIGAAGAMLSAIPVLEKLLAKPAEIGALRNAAVTAAPFALAVAACAAVLLYRHDTLSVALLGLAIGWLATIGILLAGLMHGPKSAELLRSEPLTLIAGAGFAASLCAAVALGDFHGEVTFINSSASVTWGVLALAVAAAIPLLLLLTSVADLFLNPEPDARRKAVPTKSDPAKAAARAAIGRAIIAFGGVAAAARMLANRADDTDSDKPASTGALYRYVDALIGQHRLSEIVAIGLVIGLLVWWITASMQSRKADEDDAALPRQNSALSVLIALGGAMAVFQMLAGFGVALMFIGIWPAVGLALLSANKSADESVVEQRQACALQMVQIGALGALLALFRVYTTVNEGQFPRNPYTDQYAAFGFIAGLALPLFLAQYLAGRHSSSGRTLARLLVTGALLLGAPTLMLMLWGQKCVMAFLTALAVSSALSATASSQLTVAGLVRKLLPALYALGLSLALCEWSHYVLNSEDWTRVQKERVMMQIVGAAIALILATDYGPRLVVWIRRDKPATAGTAGTGAAK